MAVLTSHHVEFVNAPIPGILAMWGKETRYKKTLEFMKHKLMEERNEQLFVSTRSEDGGGSLLTIVVDMNRHEFL